MSSRKLVAGFVLALTVSALGMATDTLKIVDFGRPATGWRAIDDVVMGGVSQSRLVVTPDGTGRFEGRLSLENNGGFASVRASVGSLDLSAFDGIALRVQGDGRNYRLRLHDHERFDGIAYQANFQTTGEGWQTVRLPFEDFRPTFRGRRPLGAEPLDTTRIRQVGVMIADRQAGPFRLEIERIEAFRGSD